MTRQEVRCKWLPIFKNHGITYVYTSQHTKVVSFCFFLFISFFLFLSHLLTFIWHYKYEDQNTSHTHLHSDTNICIVIFLGQGIIWLNLFLVQCFIHRLHIHCQQPARLTYKLFNYSECYNFKRMNANPIKFSESRV